MSSRNTATLESDMLDNKLFMVFYECGRCVGKPHGYYNPYVKTVPHEESGLWNIFISNTAHPVSTAKINRCEVLCTSHLVQ